MSDRTPAQAGLDEIVAASKADRRRSDAEADYWRKRAKRGRWVPLVSLVLGFLLAAFIGYNSWASKGDTHTAATAASSANHTLDRVANPKATATQLQGFYAVETSIFRQDCRAKGHQLNYLGELLGGHPDLAVLTNFCEAIQPPPPSPTP